MTEGIYSCYLIDKESFFVKLEDKKCDFYQSKYCDIDKPIELVEVSAAAETDFNHSKFINDNYPLFNIFKLQIFVYIFYIIFNYKSYKKQSNQIIKNIIKVINILLDLIIDIYDDNVDDIHEISDLAKEKYFSYELRTNKSIKKRGSFILCDISKLSETMQKYIKITNLLLSNINEIIKDNFEMFNVLKLKNGIFLFFLYNCYLDKTIYNNPTDNGNTGQYLNIAEILCNYLLLNSSYNELCSIISEISYAEQEQIYELANTISQDLNKQHVCINVRSKEIPDKIYDSSEIPDKINDLSKIMDKPCAYFKYYEDTQMFVYKPNDGNLNLTPYVISNISAFNIAKDTEHEDSSSSTSTDENSISKMIITKLKSIQKRKSSESNYIVLTTSGLSGSGKTYSLVGKNGKKGILHEIFKELSRSDSKVGSDADSDLEESDASIRPLSNNVEISFFEILEIIGSEVKYRSSEPTKFDIDIKDIYTFIENIFKCRVEKRTVNNPNSSRNHLFVIIKYLNIIIIIIDFAGRELRHIEETDLTSLDTVYEKICQVVNKEMKILSNECKNSIIEYIYNKIPDSCTSGDIQMKYYKYKDNEIELETRTFDESSLSECNKVTENLFQMLSFKVNNGQEEPNIFFLSYEYTNPLKTGATSFIPIAPLEDEHPHITQVEKIFVRTQIVDRIIGDKNTYIKYIKDIYFKIYRFDKFIEIMNSRTSDSDYNVICASIQKILQMYKEHINRHLDVFFGYELLIERETVKDPDKVKENFKELTLKLFIIPENITEELRKESEDKKIINTIIYKVIYEYIKFLTDIMGFNGDKMTKVVESIVKYFKYGDNILNIYTKSLFTSSRAYILGTPMFEHFTELKQKINDELGLECQNFRDTIEVQQKLNKMFDASLFKLSLIVINKHTGVLLNKERETIHRILDEYRKICNGTNNRTVDIQPVNSKVATFHKKYNPYLNLIQSIDETNIFYKIFELLFKLIDHVDDIKLLFESNSDKIHFYNIYCFWNDRQEFIPYIPCINSDDKNANILKYNILNLLIIYITNKDQFIGNKLNKLFHDKEYYKSPEQFNFVTASTMGGREFINHVLKVHETFLTDRDTYRNYTKVIKDVVDLNSQSILGCLQDTLSYISINYSTYGISLLTTKDTKRSVSIYGTTLNIIPSESSESSKDYKYTIKDISKIKQLTFFISRNFYILYYLRYIFEYSISTLNPFLFVTEDEKLYMPSNIFDIDINFRFLLLNVINHLYYIVCIFKDIPGNDKLKFNYGQLYSKRSIDFNSNYKLYKLVLYEEDDEINYAKNVSELYSGYVTCYIPYLGKLINLLNNITIRSYIHQIIHKKSNMERTIFSMLDKNLDRLSKTFDYNNNTKWKETRDKINRNMRERRGLTFISKNSRNYIENINESLIPIRPNLTEKDKIEDSNSGISYSKILYDSYIKSSGTLESLKELQCV